MIRDHRFDLHLVVVTNVAHWEGDGQPYAYEPYAREIELWAALFSKVTICAPRGVGEMRGNLAQYKAPNIVWEAFDYNTLGVDGKARFQRLLQLPSVVLTLQRLIRKADLVQLRSPSHPALMARLLARVQGKKAITKWAGFFGAYDGERMPRRIERLLIERERWPALVYGPASRSHLVSFIPALMSRAELQRAVALASGKEWKAPWKILSVGRLTPVKGFDLALEGLAVLRKSHPALEWTYTLVGDGKSAAELRDQAARLGIADRVIFPGALSFKEAQIHYGKANVVIMPGSQEGWPKPIAEAWAHGAVPVAAVGGIVPWIIENGGVGCVFEPNPEALSRALGELLSHPDEMQSQAERGFSAASDLSLETFAERLERVLIERCGLA